MRKIIKRILKKLPFLSNLYKEIGDYKEALWVKPGHFYSPILPPFQANATIIKVKDYFSNSNIAIDFNLATQRSILTEFKQYYSDLPFTDNAAQGLRYYYKNDYYLYSDAIFLYSMLRKLTPRKVVEIGSGFSSALMLDTNQMFLNNKINLTFIEPFPDRLFSLITDEDKSNTVIIENEVQSVSLEVFKELNENDILFVDSSHISKTGSDLNFILFEILPLLKKGVYIHFHDIFFPFEYPETWIREGRSWNEIYLLKAFLMYNSDFKIQLFSDYLHKTHSEWMSDFPLSKLNYGGNLWLKKEN